MDGRGELVAVHQLPNGSQPRRVGEQNLEARRHVGSGQIVDAVQAVRLAELRVRPVAPTIIAEWTGGTALDERLAVAIWRREFTLGDHGRDVQEAVGSEGL